MNTLKKIVFSIFIFIVVLSLSLSMKNQAEKKVQNNITKKVIKVAGDIDYPPYEYINKEGEYTGFNVDIIKKIGELENVEIKVYPMSWDEAVKALEKREVDIIQGMSASESRNKKFIFSEPIIENDYVIFTLKENNEITSVIDLKGKKVSYQSSDLAEEFLKVIDRESIKTETQSEAANLLLAKEVDAFIGNKLTGMYYLQKAESLHRVKIQGSPLLKNNYSVVGNKESIETIKIINNGINKLKSTDEYKKIYNKWFGEFLEDKSNILKGLLMVLMLGFIIAFIVIFSAAFYKEKYKKIYEKESKDNEIILEGSNIYKMDILRKEVIISSLIEKINIGIMIFDKNSILERFNSTAKELLDDDLIKGVSLDSLKIGKGLGYYNPILEGDIERSIEINNKNITKKFDIKISNLIDKKEDNVFSFIIEIRKLEEI